MKKSLVVSVIVLLVLAVGAGAWWFLSHNQKESNPSVINQSGEIDKLKAENAKLAQKLDETNKILENQIKKDVAKVDSESTAKDAPAKPNNGMMNQIAGQVSAMQKSMSEAKLLALKERLKLTDDQTAQVKKILEDEAERGVKLTKQLLAGKKITGDEIQGPVATIESVLTPEQAAEYTKYVEEQATQARENMANMELGQITQMFKITEEQKDQIFAKLIEPENSITTTTNSPEISPTDAIEKTFENKKEMMKSILTPEQFDIYSKFLDQQKQAVVNMMGKP